MHPFVDAELLMPVDDRFDFDKYVEPASTGVQLGGQTWGLPISSDGHLMLIYNVEPRILSSRSLIGHPAPGWTGVS